MKPELEEIVRQADKLLQVKKSELLPGDELVLKTRNSFYTVEVESDGRYRVSGGWFDKTELSPHRTTINGCTWGGSAIKTDIVAAIGLFVEFGDRLLTSRVQQIVHIPRSIKN